MAKSEMRSAYIPHDRVFAPIEGPSMTRQEFAEECDINNLMERYEKVGGVFPQGNGTAPLYLDLTETATDFQSAMNLMLQANEAFMTLPAKVRREFDNDPAAFVEFAQDRDNLEQMREWGLAPPAPAPSEPRGELPPAASGAPAAPASSPAASTQ